MDVSVVIRTKNEAEFIGDTLERVQEQEFGGKHEIVIVDSGSTDSTLDIVRRYDVTLVEIPEREFTYGRALNIAASNAKGEFIVNLSAHALPSDRKWLTHLVAGFEDEEVVAVYGRQLAIGHLNPFEALLSDLFFGKNKVRFDSKNRRTLRKIHFTNSNAAIRKDVLERVRFNEQVIYGEDILWQGEIIKAGLSILYAPDAVVHHTHQVSIPSVYKNSLNCGYNWSLVEEKRQWVWLIIVDLTLFLVCFPHSMMRHLRYILRHRYYEYLKIAPFWVLSESLGSLVGRINYRVKREL